MTVRVLLLFLVIFISLNLFSQNSDSTAIAPKDDKFAIVIEKVFKYFPLPFAGYSTETSTVFGITKYNGFKVKSTTLPDSLIQPSSVLLYGYYTMNNQYKIYANIDLMHGDNRFNSKFEFLLLDYPSLYFGIGDNTSEDDEVLIDFKNILISPSFDYNFFEKMYIGGKYTFNNYIDVKPVGDDSLIRDKNITDNEGIQSGLGLRFIREKRDNRIRARNGSYIFMSFDAYTHVLGSEHDYTSFLMDLRKYYTPIPQLTIAGQFYTEIKSGDVPIQSMALLGGTERMRGVYENRYRDKTVSMAQLELRFPIFWIIGGTTFAGMGQVAPTYGDFKMDGFKYGYGAGLRLLIDKKTSSVLRFDISFREDGHSIFIGFNEAF
jgi:hypothetical protein